MQAVDVVFHTAAFLGNSNKPAKHYSITVKGTQAVMNAALQAGVERVVHTSSIAALGVPSFPSELNPPERSPILNENSTFNIRGDYWLYGYAKYLAEMEIQKYVAKGLDVVIVNPSYVVGPGDIYRLKDSPFERIASNHVPFIPTGGINIVHIQDVVNGQIAAMNIGKRGERYILAQENLTFKSLFQKISDQTHIPVKRIVLPGKIVRPFVNPLRLIQSVVDIPVPVELIRFAGYGFYVNNEKSIRDLELTYHHSADDAIRDALAWFQDQHKN
jgi:dihydroflavonol-4-reductase